MGPHEIRNLGIVAHIDAGKTTVSERILFLTGVERRMGEVHEGTAVMDWMDEERRRGITISSAATTVPWRDHTINLIDTPGHVDFTLEVERCMRVLDGAVLVLDGVAGVQAQSETVWRQMKRHEVPFIAFANQCDRAGAEYFGVVADLRDRLGIAAIPVQMPIGMGGDFRGVVDLVNQEAWEWEAGSRGENPQRGGVPENLGDEVGVLRQELLEVLSEENEEILAAVVEERDPGADLVRQELRRRTLSGTLTPVLCGAALKHMGIQPLLDAVVDLLPSPSDLPAVQGVDPETGAAKSMPPDEAAPLCALAFKLVADPHEDLTYARIYSGTISPRQKLWNPRVRRMERVLRVLRMHAGDRQVIESAGPGEIVALAGCRFTATGDTLGQRSDPIVLESLEISEPVLTMVVEPIAAADRDRLHESLQRLAFEDPSFQVREDAETGQWLIKGMGELHLEIKRHRLEEEFSLPVRVGKPRVAYREEVVGQGTGSARVDRILGGKPAFGEVELTILPRADEEGSPPVVVWGDTCPIPSGMRPAVEEALLLGAEVGPRFGFPLVNAVLEVRGGGSQPEKDSEVGFSQAASQAQRNALAEAEVCLLEPIMAFEIQAPEEFMGGIIAELNAWKADISDLKVEEGLRTVMGRVPLVHAFGYSTTLRSLSQGRASFSLTPAGFRAVPEEELAARGLVWG